MAQRGRVHTEPCNKRLRALIAGETVLDTTSALLVWEVPTYPAYYVPAADVRCALEPTGEMRHSPSRGDAEVLDLRLGNHHRPSAAWRYPEPELEEMRDHVRFEWESVDDWLEEDEPVYTHPRDPYTRVDILASSRHVKVVVDGLTVAESRTPRILFETHLPPRYYMPMSDVRMDLLTPSDTVTHCPYKGAATYWSLVLDDRRYEDFVWCYRSPFAESQKIAGLVCFYNEKVDIIVDGVQGERPHTKFS